MGKSGNLARSGNGGNTNPGPKINTGDGPGLQESGNLQWTAMRGFFHGISKGASNVLCPPDVCRCPFGAKGKRGKTRGRGLKPTLPKPGDTAFRDTKAVLVPNSSDCVPQSSPQSSHPDVPWTGMTGFYQGISKDASNVLCPPDRWLPQEYSRTISGPAGFPKVPAMCCVPRTGASGRREKPGDVG